MTCCSVLALHCCTSPGCCRPTQAANTPRNKQAVLEPCLYQPTWCSPLCWVSGGCPVSPVCRGFPGAECSKGKFLGSLPLKSLHIGFLGNFSLQQMTWKWTAWKYPRDTNYFQYANLGVWANLLWTQDFFFFFFLMTGDINPNLLFL